MLRGAPVEIVRALKLSAAARQQLLRWLEGAGLEGISDGPDPGDHFVAACAAALAASSVIAMFSRLSANFPISRPARPPGERGAFAWARRNSC